MARYRTKPQVVEAIQALNGLWMIKTPGGPDSELLDVLSDKVFRERYELDDGSPLLCARCRAEVCESGCTGQHFRGGAAWEEPETPAKPRGRE